MLDPKFEDLPGIVSIAKCCFRYFKISSNKIKCCDNA